MAFTQEALNYTTEYSAAMANAYPHWSHFSDLYASPNSAQYKPVSGKIVAVESMTTSGAKAVNRNHIDGVFDRNFNTDKQFLEMQMDREWNTLVDPMDMQQDAIVNLANITKTFNQFQKLPEQDAYAASKLASAAASVGFTDSTTLTATNILAQWDTYLAYMTDQRVPLERLRCKMTPDTYKLLKEAAGITRFINANDGAQVIDRNASKLDGVAIEAVPKDLMLNSYDFTEGWVAASGASQINMLLFDPLAIAAPVVYDVSMISPPTAQSKGKHLYYERYYYDVFALNQRLPGIFVNIASAPTIGSVTVTSTAGSATGDTIIAYSGIGIGSSGNPVDGLDVYITVNNTAAPTVTYGAALPSTVTWTKISGTNPYAAASQTAGKYATVALVNKQTGFAVSVGSAVEVVGA